VIHDTEKGNEVDMRNFSIGITTACRHSVVLVIFLLLLLPACANGWGGDRNATARRDSVIPARVGKDPGPGVSDIRREFLDAVNRARSVKQVCGNTPYGPAPLVSWSGPLSMAAYLHSKDMVRKNFLSHSGSNGSSAGDRISLQGYPWRTYGENIAAGNPTVPSVIQGWIASAAHCRNLMNPDFTEIGAGYAIGPYGGNPAARLWTFNLADR